jgi:hypothetical protein
LEEARSEAATAQSLLEKGGGAAEQREEAATLMAAILEAREAWEARGRGLEALDAGENGNVLGICSLHTLGPIFYSLSALSVLNFFLLQRKARRVSELERNRFRCANLRFLPIL